MVQLVDAIQEVPGAFCHEHCDKRTSSIRVCWLVPSGFFGKWIVNPRCILSILKPSWSYDLKKLGHIIVSIWNLKFMLQMLCCIVNLCTLDDVGTFRIDLCTSVLGFGNFAFEIVVSVGRIWIISVFLQFRSVVTFFYFPCCILQDKRGCQC
jgi:hypothetical protein